MKNMKKMDHIYIFDYNNGRIYHDLIERGKDYLEYYEEHNLSEDECNCMITRHVIYIEDVQPHVNYETYNSKMLFRQSKTTVSKRRK